MQNLLLILYLLGDAVQFWMTLIRRRAATSHFLDHRLLVGEKTPGTDAKNFPVFFHRRVQVFHQHADLSVTVLKDR